MEKQKSDKLATTLGRPISAPKQGAARFKPPMLASPQLVAAMGHPTRAHAVTVLNERVACAAEIGRELNQPARHVSYHLQQLEKLGVIELVRVEQMAGGRTTGRFYQALKRSWCEAKAWKGVHPSHQGGINAHTLAACAADMAGAVTSGTIHLADSHISRTPLMLDWIGYRKLIRRLDVLLEEVVEIQQQSAARMTRAGKALPVKVHVFQFRCQEPGDDAVQIATASSVCEPLELVDCGPIAAFEHPTRINVLMVLNERVSSAAEIGRALDLPLGHISYHLKCLWKLGLIEEVGSPRTGGQRTGRSFRALVRPWFDLENWNAVDPKRQAAITAAMLALCNADLAEAARTGMIDEADSHISRTPMIVDRRGYRELGRLLDDVIEEMLLIQQSSATRIEEGARRLASKVHLFQFESPDPDRKRHLQG